MDCTGSMGSYIQQARQNIITISETIIAKEQADIRLAMIEYRDHKPQGFEVSGLQFDEQNKNLTN